MPVSDEAAHVNQVLRLAGELPRANGVEWLHRLLFSRESYPQLPYLVALPFLGHSHTLDGVRMAWLAVTGLGSLLIGRMATERVGAVLALGLVLTLVGSPIALAYSHLYMIDHPVYIAVAVTLFGLDWCDWFRRPERAWMVTVGMIACMLTKWTGVLFLAPLLGWAGLVATARTPGGWPRRVGAGLAVAAVLTLLAAATWGSGATSAASQAGPNGPLRLLPVVSVLVGLVLLALAHRVTRTSLGAVLLAGVTVTLVAGPWYVLVHDALLARQAHELAMLAAERTARAGQDAILMGQLQCAVPYAPIVAVLAAIAAALRPRAVPPTLVAVAGAVGVSVWLNRHLPFDPRYYLPAGALVVAAVAYALVEHGRSARTAAGLLLIVALVPTTFLPLAQATMPAAAARVGPGTAGLNFGLNQGVPPRQRYERIAVGAFTRADVDALMEAVDTACAGPGCVVTVRTSGPVDLQARSVEALAGLRGHTLRAVDVTQANRPEGPRPTLWINGACPGLPGGIALGGGQCAVWLTTGPPEHP